MNFTKLVNKILKEMSGPWPDYEETDSYLDSAKVPLGANFIQTVSLSGAKYNIHEYIYKNKAASLYITDSDEKMMMTIRLAIYENDNHIQISSLQKRKNAPFHYSDLIKKFLLKRYSYIVSDESHTKASFALYKRLASDPEVRLIVWNAKTDESVQVDNGQDLEQYYGVGLEHFRYKIYLNR